jgi:hypothetical protein
LNFLAAFSPFPCYCCYEVSEDERKATNASFLTSTAFLYLQSSQILYHSGYMNLRIDQSEIGRKVVGRGMTRIAACQLRARFPFEAKNSLTEKETSEQPRTARVGRFAA